MPKYSDTFRADVKRDINNGLQIKTLVRKYGIPASTARLWAKEVAAENSKRTHSIPLETVAPSTTIVSRSMTKIERSFVSKLLETYKPIALSPSDKVQNVATKEVTATNHIIIKDYNAFYDKENDNLEEALDKSFRKVLTAVLSNPNTDVTLHFVGDHFNTGSLYLKRIDEPELYRVFMAVFDSIRNLIVRAKNSMPNKNVYFQVEGADFRGSLLDSFLKQTFMMPYIKPEDTILFLSGLSSKSKEDEHIIKSFKQSQGEIIRTVYTDLKDLKLGPVEFSFGDLNITKGLVALRTLKGNRLCTVNIIHW